MDVLLYIVLLLCNLQFLCEESGKVFLIFFFYIFVLFCLSRCWPIQMFSTYIHQGAFSDCPPESGSSWATVEPGPAESHCHCRPWHGQGHSAVPWRAGGQSEWEGAPAWTRRLHSVRWAGKHQAGAPASSGGEEPHSWFLTEEQVRRNAPHLYWGEKTAFGSVPLWLKREVEQVHRQPQSQLCLLLMSHICCILSLMFYLDAIEQSCSGFVLLFSVQS